MIFKKNRICNHLLGATLLVEGKKPLPQASLCVGFMSNSHD